MKTLHFETLAHILLGALVTALSLACTSVTFACDCAKNAARPSTVAAVATSDAQSGSSRKFPLKGVVTDILADQSALMVKHEAIPGVMKAMTMLFAVDSSALTIVKKGDAITAVMSRTADGTWRLDDVKVTAKSETST